MRHPETAKWDALAGSDAVQSDSHCLESRVFVDGKFFDHADLHADNQIAKKQLITIRQIAFLNHFSVYDSAVRRFQVS